MQEFIRRKTLENCQKLLAGLEDDAECSRIQKLLIDRSKPGTATRERGRRLAQSGVPAAGMIWGAKER